MARGWPGHGKLATWRTRNKNGPGLRQPPLVIGYMRGYGVGCIPDRFLPIYAVRDYCVVSCHVAQCVNCMLSEPSLL